MTTLKICKSLLLAIALLLVTNAVAAEKSSLTLLDPVSVAGKQLKSGDYTLQWEGNGPNVELSILKGKAVVATIPARLVDMDHPTSLNTITTTQNNDGGRSLSEIRLRGRKYTLQIGGEPAQTAAASDTK